MGSTKVDLIMAHLSIQAPPSHVDSLLATRAQGAPIASPMARA